MIIISFITSVIILGKEQLYNIDKTKAQTFLTSFINIVS